MTPFIAQDLVERTGPAQRVERQIDGACTEGAGVMFAPRQGEAARPPEVSGRNGAPVETHIECLDRNGDSFSSKLNDRNVSPAGLQGTGDKGT